MPHDGPGAREPGGRLLGAPVLADAGRRRSALTPHARPSAAPGAIGPLGLDAGTTGLPLRRCRGGSGGSSPSALAVEACHGGPGPREAPSAEDHASRGNRESRSGVLVAEGGASIVKGEPIATSGPREMPEADQHLARPPITEAVLDIRVSPDGPRATAALDAFQATLGDRYPVRRSVDQFQVKFGDEAEVPQRTNVGYIYWNAEEDRAVQARFDGFTVNHLKPYQGWASLLADAREHWRSYTRCLPVGRVIGLGVRYINRLEVPTETDLALHLGTRFDVAPTLPQLMDQYFARVTIPFGNGKSAVIQQATESGRPRDGVRGLIFDVEAQHSCDLDHDSEAIWEHLEELRRIKNRCFFESIKPSTLEVYR